jgi:hypothetical protein
VTIFEGKKAMFEEKISAKRFSGDLIFIFPKRKTTFAALILN